MRLTAVDIRDVRVVARAAFEPGSLNLFHGPNAAGKTSLLEALHLLGFGRSFTGGRPDGLIRSGAGPMRVVARLAGAEGVTHRLGIERSVGGGLRMRMDGRNVERVAELAHALPMVAVHPGSHEVLAGGPGERRRLLDWGLFHVEQSYHRLWQRYRRAVAQRNALLRAGAADRELGAWEPELVVAATEMDRQRRLYVESLQGWVDELAGRIMRSGGEIVLRYRPGWPEEETLEQALRSRRGRDRELHATSVGPHRAELSVRMNGRDSRNRVSRGQQKLLVYLLRLAQARDLRARAGLAPVLLFDDVAAELDQDHRQRVLGAAIETGSQLFATALEPEGLSRGLGQGFTLFHVEQGELQEVVQ